MSAFSFSISRPYVCELPPMVDHHGHVIREAEFWVSTDPRSGEGELCLIDVWYAANVDAFGQTWYGLWDEFWFSEAMRTWDF